MKNSDAKLQAPQYVGQDRPEGTDLVEYRIKFFGTKNAQLDPPLPEKE